MRNFFYNKFRDLHLKDSAPRLVSLFLSLLIFYLGLSFLEIEQFATYQIVYAVAAFLIWISDLGTLQSMIHRFQTSSFAIASQFSNKILLTTMLLVAYSFVNPNEVEGLYIVLFCISCDLITDGFMSFRQVASRIKNNLLLQLAKRSSQATSILVIYLIKEDISLVSYSLAIGLPALLLLIYDFLSLKGSRLPSLGTFSKFNSIRFQIPSGGSQFSGLDLLILASGANYDAIAVLSLARRINSGFSILAISWSVSDFVKASNLALELESFRRKKIVHGFLITFLNLSTALAIIIFLWQYVLPEVGGDYKLLYLMASMVGALGSLNGVQVSILMAYQSFLLANIVSWLPTTIYILILVYITENDFSVSFLGFIIFMKVSIEYLLSSYFYSKVSSKGSKVKLNKERMV